MDEKTIPLNKLPVDVKVQLSAGKKAGPGLDYRALFEQTGECVFIIGLDFKVITANPQALLLLGFTEEELFGTPVEYILSLDDSAEREMILDRRIHLTEHTLRKKDGSTLPVELSISVVHNEANLPIYIQLIARDITERKQNERILKRNMRAQSIIGEVTAVLFRSSNIEAVLPQVLESLGYALGVFGCAVFSVRGSTLRIKNQWVEPTHPGFEARMVIGPVLNSLIEVPDRVFSATDIPIEFPDISHVSMLAIPIQGVMGSWGFLGLFDKEDQLAWLPSIFDIVQTTANLLGAAFERIHHEETLRLSERRNRIIVDALPDLLLRVDRSGRIFDYNVNPSHSLHLDPESVIGKNLHTLWNDEVAAMLLPGDAENAFFTSPCTVENFRLAHQDNIFEARLFPLSKMEALIIVRDITEQARLNQMKSDFINRASHELRTPLTASILMTELLRQGGPPEEMQQYIDALSGELNRQKNLINQLLTAGRLERGTMPIEPVVLDLIPVLHDSISAVKPMADKRGVKILLNAPIQPLYIRGDANGLQQVFINLINNAVKFSPDDSRVEILAARDEAETRISVMDLGLGIPPDAMPHLFGRFYRARNATTAEIPGSGLGLYIVKTILGEMGGSISLKSRLNEGTTFTVSLRNGQS
ncbi:MAG: PAS domain S-box protein [Anaerolineales bacterium]|nr:PAS domain S-box protein [Anaerolineales bacterium]